METGENSGSNSSGEDVWAKLVSSDSSYSDIELRSTDVKICSETKSSSSKKREWSKITRENDQISALIQNKSRKSILVDGMPVREDDATIIRCGSEIILGPEADGFRRYMFKVMPTNEICKKQLKVVMDPENAKCSICLSVWHDVVTVSPCLHNFCKGCFSMWSKRCQDKRRMVLCPQCRAVAESVGRNNSLHSIGEDILKSDSSLRRSDEEIAHLDSCSSIKLPPAKASRIKRLEQTIDEQKQSIRVLKQKIARIKQMANNHVVMVRKLASHVNFDISQFEPFPQPLPDTDSEDEDTEDDEEDEEELTEDEEEEHTDDEEEH